MKNFQSSSSEQGDRFAEVCLDALSYAGFEVVKTKVKLPEVGIEIDAHTMNAHGISMWWEFKGSMQGDRPGSKRTDTLKKAIANGYLFSISDIYQCCAPMILMTSHVPTNGSGHAMLASLERSIFFDVLNPYNHSKRLRWIAGADDRALEGDMMTYKLIDLIDRQWGIT